MWYIIPDSPVKNKPLSPCLNLFKIIGKDCASHKERLSVPSTPPGTSPCEASLHAPKVYVSSPKAHFVEKNPFCLWGKKRYLQLFSFKRNL